MRVLDFDNTIYDGESVVDFYLFSLRYRPRVIKYMPVVLYHLVKYKMGKTTMDDLVKVAKTYATAYVKEFEDIPRIVGNFWDKNMHKIKPWYSVRPDDVLLTASFDLIMDELCRRLGVQNCICSKFNLKTMTVDYINFSHSKKEIFQQIYGKNVQISEFYTDHKLDAPLFAISQNVYLVKGNKIRKVK